MKRHKAGVARLERSDWSHHFSQMNKTSEEVGTDSREVAGRSQGGFLEEKALSD